MSFAATVERLRTLSNPYPGLRPFDTSESHLFFGRDQQVAELVGRLEGNRFLAVVGVSGGGKSSLVRAGLIPALSRGRLLEAGQRWRVAVTRPGAAPFASLAADLRQVGLDASPLTQSSHGLIVVAQQLAPDESLLVVIDQFEELFRYKDSPLATEDARRRRGLSAAEAAEFVQLLLAASRSARPVYIVLTMRSDYLGDCAEFRDLPETLNDCQYLVPRMTREQRKEAVEVPLGSVAIAPSLVQRLLNDAGDEPDQLPVLQHALMRTWNHWRSADPERTRRLELEDYTAIGGFRDAIDQHADEVCAVVDATIAETIFRRLTARGRGNRERRDPATVDEICAICGATDADARSRVVGVIDRFRLGEATFLTPRDGVLSGATYVDLTHESLIRQWGRLRDRWLPEEQQSAKTFLDLVERARRWEAGRAEPLSGLDLGDALQWERQRNATVAWAEHYADAKDLDLVLRFIRASRAHDRRQRLRKQGLLVAAPLAVVFAALSIVAVYQTRQAGTARTVSVARQLAAQSQLLQNEQVNLEPGVLLAVEALRLFPSVDTERALRQSVARVPLQIAAIPLSQGLRRDPVRELAVCADGSSVAVVSLSTVKVFDARTWQETSTLTSPYPALAIAPGSPGTWVIATASPTALSVLAMPGGQEVRRFPPRALSVLAMPGGQEVRRFPPRSFPAAIALSRDGRYLVSISDATRVHDITTGREVVLPATSKDAARDTSKLKPSALAISPDGRWVAIATAETTKATDESTEMRGDFRASVFDATGRSAVVAFEFTSMVRVLAFGGDGRLLAAASEDGTTRVFNLETGREPARLNTGASPVSVALSDDARLVATGHEDGTARVFDAASGAEIARLSHEWRDVPEGPDRKPPPAILAVAMSHDGRLVFSGGEDGTLHVFEAAGANDVTSVTDALPVTAIAFGKGGRRLVTGSGDIEAARVRVFDAPDWRQTIQLDPPSPEVRSVAVSADGRFLAVASNWAGGPWVYDLDDPQKRPAALGGPSLMSAVALSGDGAWAGSIASYQAQLVERASGRMPPLTLPVVHALALSENGRVAVVGEGDLEGGAAVVLQLPGARESTRVPVTGPVLFVAASPDGRWVAASGLAQSPVVHVIDTAARKEIWKHTGTSETLAVFSPDGNTVAMVSSDNALRTFETATGNVIVRIQVGRTRVLGFDDQGRSVIAASTQPTIGSGFAVNVRRYLLRRDDLIRDACNRVTRNLTESEWAQYVGAYPPYSKTCRAGS